MAEPVPRRLWVAAVAIGAAAVVAYAATRSWFDVAAGVAARLPVPVGLPAPQSPLAAALSLAALVSWGLVLVTRGSVRRLVAVFTAVLAVAVLAATAVASRSVPEQLTDLARDSGVAGGIVTEPTGWFWAAVVAAVVAAVTAVATVPLVARWPEMGTRYDRAEAAPHDSIGDGRDLWRALDEGHDPTA